MGLASALAAAQQGAPPPQLHQQQQMPYQQPSYYQQQPQAGVYAAPPPGAGAAPPPQPPPQGGMQGAVLAKLQSIVAANQLGRFYGAAQLAALAQRVARVDFHALAARWGMPTELALDLAALALYDVVLLADDSGSLAFEEGGERVEDLKLICSKARARRVGPLAARCSQPAAASRRGRSPAASTVPPPGRRGRDAV